MTVHDGKDANYTNVYQKNTTVASLTASKSSGLNRFPRTVQIGLLIFREWEQSQPLESWISNIRNLQS